MKQFFTLFFTFSFFLLHAQRPSTGSLTIFSEDGDKFTLILNGEIINDRPQSNLRVEDLNQPYYNAKIKFENQSLQDIATNNLRLVDVDGIYVDVTYKIKHDKNNASKMKMNYFSSVPVNPGFVPAQNVQVVHYGQPQQVVVVHDPVPVQTAITQTTTTTTQSTNNNVGVGVNIGGLNVGVSINDNFGNGGEKQTTTTTTQVIQPIQSQVIVQPNESEMRGCGRRSCMTNYNFNIALETIRKQSFEKSALKTAKQVITSNCLNVDQIIAITNIFKFEDSKLDFAKFAYDYCIEQRNYFKLNGIFKFSSNADALSDYVQSRN